ncbi:uncharacterized protein LOC111036861 [Myzus persicae]|uniref:uncharacterized protein LOC111036861 n=1 Tax=Myzus persicae TaxID=13164 RepID=UPI000B931382|nr:uncharacterized protein LOC111036861 [Myzus persicae]
MDLDIINHDHNYFVVQEPVVDHNEPLLPVAVARPQSYIVVLGIQRATEIIRDNLGFMYYKNKVTDTKIYLSCYEKKLEGQCHATAHISPDRNDDRLTLSKLHCHGVRESNLNVPLLRQEITERALEKTINSYTPHGIYMQAIAKGCRELYISTECREDAAFKTYVFPSDTTKPGKFARFIDGS